MNQAELIAKVSKEIKQPGCKKDNLNQVSEKLIRSLNIVDVIPGERKDVIKCVDDSGKITVVRMMIA